ncbi:MAG TPA: hypothetical protein VK255_03445, partial [Patescibacteria group bacterium]|nr:hypothetical protein [Patescibacteria group bacterium]
MKTTINSPGKIIGLLLAVAFLIALGWLAYVKFSPFQISVEQSEVDAKAKKVTGNLPTVGKELSKVKEKVKIDFLNLSGDKQAKIDKDLSRI